MTEKILLLFLDGPMQAWGYQSFFDNRNTLAYPTRSALLGMFCAALGIERHDAQGLEQLTPLKLEIQTYQKLVPRDHLPPEPILVRRWPDYHTVGHGYDPTTDRLHIPLSADGHLRQVVTKREYLSDACFVVLVMGPEDLLGRLHHALCDPRWGVWFGRKCCIPAFPICHGIFDNREQALQKRAEIARHRPMADKPLRVIREVDSFAEGSDTLLDCPLNFATRTFAPRRILEQISASDDETHDQGSGDSLEPLSPENDIT